MKKQFIRSFLLASIGALSLALAVSMFYEQGRIAAGGVTGIAVIISHILPLISTGTVALLLNIPLLLIAFFRFGKGFVIITFYATVMSSVFMNIFSPLSAAIGDFDGDLLIPAVCGAVLDALGIGLVYRAGGCTGGTDIIIKLFRQKYRHIRTGGMSFIINMAVVAASYFAFKDIKVAVYSALAIVVASFILDKVLYCGEGAKLVHIISDMYEEITCKLLSEMRIGVTLLCGKGAYTSAEKHIIFCAVKRQSFTKLREIVKNTDPDAFMIVGNATEIFGEGYKSQFTDEL